MGLRSSYCVFANILPSSKLKSIKEVMLFSQEQSKNWINIREKTVSTAKAGGGHRRSNAEM